MKKLFRIFLVIIFVLALLLACLAGVLFRLASPVDRASTQVVRFEVPYGSSVYKISSDLQEQGIIRNARLFYASARFPAVLRAVCPGAGLPDRMELKSGTYELTRTMSYAEILEELSSGQQEYVRVSVPEGLTITKTASLLEESGICTREAFRSACYDADIVSRYGIPAESLEGYLFPDTYFLNYGMSVEAVIDLMVTNFYGKISEVPGLAGKTPEELHRIINLASIVEREYKLPEEAPLIASVFENRLAQNIGLYSCATIEYIITELQGKPHPERILIEDTRIDSPYNTYKWAGLPPGPISSPGLVAISAAANPPDTSYYFFQIVNQAEGRHVFTQTFDQHVLSHNLYLKS